MAVVHVKFQKPQNIGHKKHMNELMRRELCDHMSANGIHYDYPIHFDGHIHRFSRDSKRNQQDEWYIAYQGLSPKGKEYFVVIYGSWSDGSKFTYKSWDSHRYDENERVEFHRALQQRQEEAAQAILHQKQQAAQVAQEIWDKSSATLTISPYVSLKKITPYEARFGNNPKGYPSLILPLRNVVGDLRSLQFISVGEDGTVYKTFLNGSEKRGNFLALGELKDGLPIQIAEGYATACDCQAATGISTIVAFDCGNLDPVVSTIREYYPHSELILCADNDAHTPHNPGKTVALAVAVKYLGKVALPHFAPQFTEKRFTDFNDLMQTSGIQEVKTQIENAKPPLEWGLDAVQDSPHDHSTRTFIYQLAHQTFVNGNFTEKDLILNKLCKVLTPLGVTKTSINKEFKQYIKENNDKNLKPSSQRPLPEVEAKLIDALTETFGPPVILNTFREPENINQLFFANRYAQETLILYEPTEKCFYEYRPETGLWIAKTDDTVKVDIGHFFLRFIDMLGYKELLASRTENLLQQLLNLLKGSIEKTDIFQTKPGVIHVGNGVLHLENPDQLLSFSPDYYSRNRSEILLDPIAECSRFLNTLLNPAISQDDSELLQKYCGQCLLGYNISQTLLLISGTPGGGKSTLVSLIEKVIGLHNVAQLKVGLLSERFENASFVGKTLLTGKDVPGNFLNNPGGASVLKALVGADRLSFEQKHLKRRIEARGEFNVIITSNARLHVRLDSDTGAWQRRLLMVEFEQVPPDKPIPHLDDLLIEQEGPGILNWMIEGAIKLLYEIEQYGRLKLSKNQRQRIESLLAESDSVRAFVLQCIEASHGSDVTIAELLEAYTDFCESRGWRAETVSHFESQIPNTMLEIHRRTRRNDIKRLGKSQRGFMHVALKKISEEVE